MTITAWIFCFLDACPAKWGTKLASPTTFCLVFAIRCPLGGQKTVSGHSLTIRLNLLSDNWTKTGPMRYLLYGGLPTKRNFYCSESGNNVSMIWCYTIMIIHCTRTDTRSRSIKNFRVDVVTLEFEWGKKSESSARHLNFPCRLKYLFSVKSYDMRSNAASGFRLYKCLF